MKKLGLIYGLFITFLAFLGCGKDGKEEIVNELTLSKSEISVVVGQRAEIEISNGNDGYKVTSEDVTTAMVSVSERKILVEAKKVGTTKIIVTDAKNKKIEVNVYVYTSLALSKESVSVGINSEEEIEILSGEGPFEVSVNNENTTTTISEKKVKIVGKSIGTSVVTIKDTKTEVTQNFAVVVSYGEFSIENNQEEVAVKIGTEKNIVLQGGSGQFEVTFDNGNATISKEGTTIKVTGVSKGTTIVSIKDLQTNVTKVVRVAVKDVLKLGQTSVNDLFAGNYEIISVEKGEPTQVSSANETIAVARIESFGKDNAKKRIIVEGKAAGRTTIQVSDGATTLDIPVSVLSSPAFSVEWEEEQIRDGGKITVYGIGPDNQNYVIIDGSGNYEIKSSNTAVFKVSKWNRQPNVSEVTIELVGVKIGKGTLTITDKGKNETRRISVTVEEAPQDDEGEE